MKTFVINGYTHDGKRYTYFTFTLQARTYQEAKEYLDSILMIGCSYEICNWQECYNFAGDE